MGHFIPGTEYRPPLVRWSSVFRKRPVCAASHHGGASVAEPRVPAAVYCATFVINVLALAQPLVILQVYDRIIPNRSHGTLGILFAGLVLVLILDFALKRARAALLSWQSTHFVRRLADEAVTRLLRAPTDTVELTPASAHIGRYAAISALGEYHSGQSKMLAIDLPFVAIGLVVMALVGGTMAVIPILLFFLLATLTVRRSRNFRAVMEQRTAQDNKKYDFVAEALTGILTIKVMAMEPQMQRRFERLQQAVAEITSKSIMVGHVAQNSAVLYGSVSQIVVVAIGATRVIDDQLSIGALACCTLLSGQILQPLLRAMTLWIESETVNHRRAEVETLLDLPLVQEQQETAQIADVAVRFERVTFAYPDQSSPVLTDATFAIPSGAVVGIKGQDGSGRSTLLKILRGDLAPTSGRVTLAGISTTDPEFAGIRPCIAYVGAVPVIFRGTILENLTLFRPERNQFAYKMCELVGLDAAINILPDGFDTKLGEGLADDLPTSVAQQVCIVRALTAQPSVIVLDEVNNVLDRTAEAALARAITAMRGRQTVIMATHRPSLLAMSDMLLTVRQGHVESGHVESGRVESSRVETPPGALREGAA